MFMRATHLAGTLLKREAQSTLKQIQGLTKAPGLKIAYRHVGQVKTEI
jgi:hypothetical protein